MKYILTLFVIIVLSSNIAAQSKADPLLTKTNLKKKYEQQIEKLQQQLQDRANELVRVDVTSNRIDAMIVLLKQQLKDIEPDSTSEIGKSKEVKK
jgi:hypothetical protein